MAAGGDVSCCARAQCTCPTRIAGDLTPAAAQEASVLQRAVQVRAQRSQQGGGQVAHALHVAQVLVEALVAQQYVLVEEGGEGRRSAKPLRAMEGSSRL